MMRCSSCQCRIPSSYAKTHIDRCKRAAAKRKSVRYKKYNKDGV